MHITRCCIAAFAHARTGWMIRVCVSACCCLATCACAHRVDEKGVCVCLQMYVWLKQAYCMFRVGQNHTFLGIYMVYIRYF
jgi:hypothetical protein